ncbi:alpha/beta hydrolase [Kineococcus terrestris]|uniref:alpha/beta hydrolase n=1 Tax=Kineococcus terrestris TaxID=2044856 RepID=UPI0034DADCBB
MEQVDVDVHEGGERTATVLPGRGYTCDGPLLRDVRRLLRERGWTVRTVRWTTPPTPRELLALAPDLLDGMRARPHLVVAKSLSTRLLPAAVERDLPGIWLTPLLREADVVSAATRSSAPALLVGGSADPYWDGGAARRSGRRVLEVAGADHSVEVPGDAAATARALQAVVAAAAGFLDDLP